MQKLIPMHICTAWGTLVCDESHSHRANVSVVDEVTHRVLHIHKLDVGVLANTLHQFVNDFVGKFMIDSNKGLVGENKACRATRLSRAKVCREHNGTAVANLFADLFSTNHIHTAQQCLVANARLAYSVDNLLGKISVCTSANFA